MHIPWEAVELFLAAAEHKSLAKAAKALGVTQPTVSRCRIAGKSALVPLPIPLGPMKVGIYLVCARSALAVPRIRAVADLLTTELAPDARVPRS
jgi:DNA-binding transcriptional LysR family regulator